MSRESCTVEVGAGVNLDCRIYKPSLAGERHEPKYNLVIVLVHPYSLLGGCQALMKGISRQLANQGFTSITFDMRGVGSSAGAPTAGSAVDKVEEVAGYVSIGYPFGLTASILFGRHHKFILQSPKPKLFVMGTKDGFTSVKQLQNKLKSAAGRVETHLVDGASHFQMEGPDFDALMADLIVSFISKL